MRIYDVSPLLHPGVAVWPGDVPFSKEQSLWIESGSSVNLSSIKLSLHTGAHVDAPFHFRRRGATIETVDLEVYWGPAHLVSLSGEGAIQAAELDLPLQSDPQRLLLRAHRLFDPDRFPSEIRYLSPEAARRIADSGVLLLGMDAPSVDPIDSKTLEAHKILDSGGTAILENLQLKDVPEGVYELSALPLRIAGGDASPVRAVLREVEAESQTCG